MIVTGLSEHITEFGRVDTATKTMQKESDDSERMEKTHSENLNANYQLGNRGGVQSRVLSVAFHRVAHKA